MEYWMSASNSAKVDTLDHPGGCRYDFMIVTSDAQQYAIRGGVKGRERLRILSRAMQSGTTSLFDRLGITDGLACLDVGCGGGDVTVELGKRVGPHGRAVGVDIDETVLDLARMEVATQGIRNIEFRAGDIRTQTVGSDFDVVYARFLLTHLEDPMNMVAAFYNHLRPGGLVIVEDIDFNGYFTWPDSAAFRRFLDLYCAVVRKRGGDPNIGPRLPFLLADGGFEKVDLNIVQPIGAQGEVKLVNPITLECVADPILEDGLASAEEIEATVRALYEFAANPRTLAGVARVIQAWGRRPG
jgi:2-polyprenyl-3-methyl-5-hydroxy-6-metoxy-1,4-benzoquinol methylase